MIGIVVQLAVSWLVVWLFEKGNLNCLGLLPAKKKLTDFVLFFSITAACSVLSFLLQMLIARQSWQLNPDINLLLIMKGTWFVIKSVLFEELIFRGVLLYILIKKMGAVKAIFISAAAFGMYHWFSHELWGNPVQMAIEFFYFWCYGIGTGLWVCENFLIVCAGSYSFRLEHSSDGCLFWQYDRGTGFYRSVTPACYNGFLFQLYCHALPAVIDLSCD